MGNTKPTVIRVAAVPQSLRILLRGQLKFLSNHYKIIGVASPGILLEETAMLEGIEVRPVKINRAISLFSDIRSLWKLYTVFNKERPIMVHSITPKAGLLSMIAATLARVPIRIHTFTGLIFPYRKGFYRILLLNMDRLLCRFATHVYPEGEGVKKDLIAGKVTNKNLKVLANGNVNGVDTSYFDPELITDRYKRELRGKLGIRPSDFVFIFIGRLVKDKGVNELVVAFKQLQSSHRNLKLLILGKFEDDLDPLEKKTRDDIDNNEAIIYAGYQTDIRPYLGISNVFAFPSYREGFPNVVLQAGAMDLPCIVTDISGSNEIIKDNVNGLIIRSKESSDLYKAMKVIVEDASLYAKLKTDARFMIEDRYKQEFVWAALLNEYKSIESTMSAKSNPQKRS